METSLSKQKKFGSEIQDHDFGFRISDFGFVFIGVGNEFRSDDAVGLHIARRLAEMDIPGAKILELSGEGAALIEAWKEAETVFLFDAVFSGENTPGTIYRMDARAENIPAGFFHYSTHRFSVAEAVELARTLDKLPKKLIIFGVEGENFDYGEILTPAVKNAIPEVVKRAMAEINVLE